MDHTHERRSAPRVEVDYAVFFYYLPPNTPSTKMLNLSVGGAALEALDPLPLGSRTSFVVVTNTREVIECSGHVTHVRPLSDSKYQIGIRFIDLTETARELLWQATGLVA